MKILALIKVANLFGNIRNMLRKFEDSGGKLTRNSLDSAHYNSTTNIINIPKKNIDHRVFRKNIENIIRDKSSTKQKLNKVEKLQIKTINEASKFNNPRFVFAHEFGHSIANKNRLKNKLKIPNYANKNSILQKLKAERMANNNALQYIKDSKDRAAFKKSRNIPYSSYRTNHRLDDVRDRIALNSKNINYKNNNNIDNRPFAEALAASNMHNISSALPALRKKPWER